MNTLERLKQKKGTTTFLTERIRTAIEKFEACETRSSASQKVHAAYHNLTDFPGEDGLPTEVKMSYAKMTDTVLDWLDETAKLRGETPMILIEKALDCFQPHTLEASQVTPDGYTPFYPKHMATHVYRVGENGKADAVPHYEGSDVARAPVVRKKPAESEAFMLLYYASINLHSVNILPFDEVEGHFKSLWLPFHGFIHRGGAWGKVTLAVSTPENVGIWASRPGAHALLLRNPTGVVRVGGCPPKRVLEKFVADSQAK